MVDSAYLFHGQTSVFGVMDFIKVGARQSVVVATGPPGQCPVVNLSLAQQEECESRGGNLTGFGGSGVSEAGSDFFTDCFIGSDPFP